MRAAKRSLSCFLVLVLPAVVASCGGSDTESNPASGKPVIALAVDADRDGKADAASAGDRAHRNEFSESVGASFLANIDDDDGDGVSDAEDEVVNGDADLLDLARIAVGAWPDAPEGAVGKLGIDAASAAAVRIFKKGLDGNWTAVGGSLGACTAPNEPCAQQVTEVTLSTAEIKAGVELGIEGRRFRISKDDAWSGEVALTLSILDKEGGTPFKSADAPDGVDHAKMRVAPWVLFGNTSPFDTLWASNISPPFVQGLTEAAKQAGVTLSLIKNWSDDQWTQDFFQTAWTAIPGEGGEVHGMRVANPRPWGRGSADSTLPVAWLKKTYLGPDRGVVVIYEKKWSGDTWDSHGNHDLIPPYENPAKGAKYPLGRIVTGSHVLPETWAFYDAQAVQGPHLESKSDWLYVGHIDEYLSYAPAATPRGWKLLVASPKLARQMLLDAQAAGNGAVKMFVGKQVFKNDTSWDMVPADTSIDDALANDALMQASQEAQAEIDAAVAILKDEIGLADDEIVEMPVLYQAFGGAKVAWTPGTVNLLALHDLIAPPDPFGPSIGGTDMWKKDLQDRFASAANQLGSTGKGLSIVFVNDWDDYHILDGEVHCGSNPEAGPPFASVKWWETGR